MSILGAVSKQIQALTNPVNGRYKFEATIGKGKFSQVKRAVDRWVHRPLVRVPPSRKPVFYTACRGPPANQNYSPKRPSANLAVEQLSLPARRRAGVRSSDRLACNCTGDSSILPPTEFHFLFPTTAVSFGLIRLIWWWWWRRLRRRRQGDRDGSCSQDPFAAVPPTQGVHTTTTSSSRPRLVV